MSYYCGWCGKTFDNPKQKPDCVICQKGKSPEPKPGADAPKEKPQASK